MLYKPARLRVSAPNFDKPEYERLVLIPPTLPRSAYFLPEHQDLISFSLHLAGRGVGWDSQQQKGGSPNSTGECPDCDEISDLRSVPTAVAANESSVKATSAAIADSQFQLRNGPQTSKQHTVGAEPVHAAKLGSVRSTSASLTSLRLPSSNTRVGQSPDHSPSKHHLRHTYFLYTLENSYSTSTAGPLNSKPYTPYTLINLTLNLNPKPQILNL